MPVFFLWPPRAIVIRQRNCYFGKRLSKGEVTTVASPLAYDTRGQHSASFFLPPSPPPWPLLRLSLQPSLLPLSRPSYGLCRSRCRLRHPAPHSAPSVTSSAAANPQCFAAPPRMCLLQAILSRTFIHLKACILLSVFSGVALTLLLVSVAPQQRRSPLAKCAYIQLGECSSNPSS